MMKVIGGVFVFGLSFVAISGASTGSGVFGAEMDTSLPLFSLENFDGRPISNSTLEGATTILVPTYAKCEFACPMITFLLNELDKELGAPEGIQYLLVSVQPELDTAEEIETHFDKHEIDVQEDRRWLFANGPKPALERFLEETGVEVSRTAIEGGILLEHTIQVVIVGPDGQTVESFDTYFWDRKEFDHALRSSLDKTKVVSP